jgi:hypothetical protein
MVQKRTKGYGNQVTGSAGCQTFPNTGTESFDSFMSKLEPMTSESIFTYVMIKI